MKIGIVGGGPAGLYFALLMKKRFPAHKVQVVEQDPADATYGWGVVFSDRALAYLRDGDADFYADVVAGLEIWDDLAIVHKGRRTAIEGNTYSGIARLELLRILQEHCRRLGVDMQFERRVTDAASLADCDLLVGADGVNSVVRQAHRERFQPSLDVRPNRYVWYGTHQVFPALTLIFREHAHGIFIAHAYRYNQTTSTFIVECDAATWSRAGFKSMSDAESRTTCQEVFEEDLGGQPLLSNRSTWRKFVVVDNRHWSHENVVLIGDALHTVHFSIGSGTRMALQDALALYRAFEMYGEDVRVALQSFEQARRPVVDRFLAAARHSFIWYENIRDRMHLDPLSFAYDYMLRTGKVDHEGLRKKDPAFVAAYEAQRTPHA
ncbi:MAG TPA: FAD-dependent monooxygenase [Anaerolineae bacterium]|nr:FAD-dependent monooxygenase [Anaerolineae bacterium]